MSWLGLDIGGANIKAADGHGYARSVYFPLWQRRDNLPQALSAVLASSPSPDRLAVTMTGELADCFVTKKEGVIFILESVRASAGDRECTVYLTTGELVALDAAIKRPMEVAASNWHVLAAFASRFLPNSNGLLIDVGSTTCDLVPIQHGSPAAVGLTDTDRLIAGELVYTGVERTPVSAITHWLPWRNRQCPVASELFATSWDAYVTRGDLPEEPYSTHTADGRPATKVCARDRLARTICADRNTFDESDALMAANYIADRQVEQVCRAAKQVIDRQPQGVQSVVLSGSGEFLARLAVGKLQLDLALAGSIQVISLAEQMGSSVSKRATAHALAVLARDRDSV